MCALPVIDIVYELYVVIVDNSCEVNKE